MAQSSRPSQLQTRSPAPPRAGGKALCRRLDPRVPGLRRGPLRARAAGGRQREGAAGGRPGSRGRAPGEGAGQARAPPRSRRCHGDAVRPSRLTCMAREKKTPASDASFFTLKSMAAPGAASAAPRPRCHRGGRPPALYSADRCLPRAAPRPLKRALGDRQGLPAPSQPSGRRGGGRGAPSFTDGLRGSGLPRERLRRRGRGRRARPL